MRVIRFAEKKLFALVFQSLIEVQFLCDTPKLKTNFSFHIYFKAGPLDWPSHESDPFHKMSNFQQK